MKFDVNYRNPCMMKFSPLKQAVLPICDGVYLNETVIHNKCHSHCINTGWLIAESLYRYNISYFITIWFLMFLVLHSMWIAKYFWWITKVTPEMAKWNNRAINVYRSERDGRSLPFRYRDIFLVGMRDIHF